MFFIVLVDRDELGMSGRLWHSMTCHRLSIWRRKASQNSPKLSLKHEQVTRRKQQAIYRLHPSTPYTPYTFNYLKAKKSLLRIPLPLVPKIGHNEGCRGDSAWFSSCNGHSTEFCLFTARMVSGQLGRTRISSFPRAAFWDTLQSLLWVGFTTQCLAETNGIQTPCSGRIRWERRHPENALALASSTSCLTASKHQMFYLR
jgi:hypothetical protein